MPANISKWVKIDGAAPAEGLRGANEKLAESDGELVLDLSAVLRIQPRALTELDRLARLAAQKSIKVVLRGVTVEVYKTLKLARLAPHFSFLS